MAALAALSEGEDEVPVGVVGKKSRAGWAAVELGPSRASCARKRSALAGSSWDVASSRLG
jgi:hypothetical protein